MRTQIAASTDVCVCVTQDTTLNSSLYMEVSTYMQELMKTTPNSECAQAHTQHMFF